LINPNCFDVAEGKCALGIFESSESIKGDDLEYELRKRLVGFKKAKGIYFLVSDEGKLLYVGKSINLLNRVTSHLEGNGGTSYKYFKLIKEIRLAIFDDKITAKELHAIEKKFIRALKPAFNGGNYVDGTTTQYSYTSLYDKLKAAKNEEDIQNTLDEWPKVGEVFFVK